MSRALQVHHESGSTLAGVHLEMTGQAAVTECTGGVVNIEELRPPAAAPAATIPASRLAPPVCSSALFVLCVSRAFGGGGRGTGGASSQERHSWSAATTTRSSGASQFRPAASSIKGE